MKILCTGSNGLISSSFLEKSTINFDEAYGIGRSAGRNIRFIKQDLRDEILVNLPNVDIILHTAAQTSTYKAYKDPLDDLNTNIGGLVRIVENYRKQNINPFIIFLGNATQIGITRSLEEVKLKKCDEPITFYDLSKHSAEGYLMMYIRNGIVKGCSLRLCNVYGTTVDHQKADRGILDKMMLKALSNENLTVWVQDWPTLAMDQFF